MVPPRWLVGWTLAMVLLGYPAPGWAAPQFVLVQVAGDTDTRGDEAALAQELTLAMDDLAVTEQPSPRPDFQALGVAEQVEALRATVMEPDILAAGWLDTTGDTASRTLVLVFASEGRAVVQLVEAPADESGLASLALAAREVLTSALPLGAFALDQPAEEQAPQPEPPRPRRWALELDGTVGLGVAHVVLPAPALGGALGGQLRIVDELWVGLGVAMTGAAVAETETSILTVGPQLRLAWLPGGERFGIGPAVWFQVAFVQVFGGGPSSDLRSETVTRPTIAPGVGGRLSLAPRLELMPALKAVIGPQLTVAKGRDQDIPDPAEPALDLELDVGVQLRF